jgi:hypothetical protein
VYELLLAWQGYAVTLEWGHGHGSPRIRVAAPRLTSYRTVHLEIHLESLTAINGRSKSFRQRYSIALPYHELSRGSRCSRHYNWSSGPCYYNFYVLSPRPSLCHL